MTAEILNRKQTVGGTLGQTASLIVFHLSIIQSRSVLYILLSGESFVSDAPEKKQSKLSNLFFFFYVVFFGGWQTTFFGALPPPTGMECGSNNTITYTNNLYPSEQIGYPKKKQQDLIALI